MSSAMRDVKTDIERNEDQCQALETVISSAKIEIARLLDLVESSTTEDGVDVADDDIDDEAAESRAVHRGRILRAKTAEDFRNAVDADTEDAAFAAANGGETISDAAAASAATAAASSASAAPSSRPGRHRRRRNFSRCCCRTRSCDFAAPRG